MEESVLLDVFFQNVRGGNFSDVKRVIEEENPEYILLSDDIFGSTGLMEAIKKEQYAIAQYLVKNDADINAADKSGFTPLIHAVRRAGDLNTSDQSVEFVKYLVEQDRINLEAEDRICCTALTHATISMNQANSSEVIKFLLDHKANINQKDFQGMSLIDLAIVHARNLIVKTLLSYGARLDTDSNNPSLFYAKNVDTLTYLIEHGAEVNCKRKEQSAEEYFQAKIPTVSQYMAGEMATMWYTLTGIKELLKNQNFATGEELDMTNLDVLCAIRNKFCHAFKFTDETTVEEYHNNIQHVEQDILRNYEQAIPVELLDYVGRQSALFHDTHNL